MRGGISQNERSTNNNGGNDVIRSVLPGLSSVMLLAGNSRTELPASMLCGTSTGELQLWGENDLAPIYEHGMGADTRIGDASITDLSTLDKPGELPYIACCNAGGCMGIFQVGNGLRRLALVGIHDACATSIDSNSESAMVASCAEDGSLCIADMRSLSSASGSGNAHSGIHNLSKVDGALNDVHFLDPNTLAIAGSMPGSFVRVWDMRVNGAGSAVKLKNAPLGPSYAATSLSSHTSIPYILAGGDIEGRITLWDVRMNDVVSLIEQHNDIVRELRFHPNNPSFLFSSSNDGSVKFADISVQPTRDQRSAAKNTVHEFFGKMSCTSIDVSVDEVAGPLLLIAGEDESVLVKALYW